MKQVTASRSSTSRLVSLVAGIACAAAGSIVMIGWHAGLGGLVAVRPGYTAVQYNTAASFLVLGLALIALHLNWKMVGAAGATFVFGLATVTALRYAIGADLPIDRLLLNASVLPIGRMAPNTAVALMATSCAIALLAAGDRWTRANSVAALLASAVAALGGVALSGYCFGVAGAYRWGDETPMAVLTAGALVAAGIGVMARAWSSSATSERRLPPWAPGCAFVLFAFISILLSDALVIDDSLIATWSAEMRRSLRINSLLTLVFGVATSAGLAGVLALAQMLYRRWRELQTVNTALFAESEERRRISDALETERRRLNDLLNLLPGYVVLLTADHRVPFANRYFEDRFGRSDGRRCYEYLFQSEKPCENCESFKVLETGAAHQWEWQGPDGKTYEIHDFPFTASDGSKLVMEMGIDVTAHKAAQSKLKRLNRALRMVSACHHAFAHATDEGDLLRSICKIAVGPAGYTMAWIGYAIDDEHKTVRPMAKAGAGCEYVTEEMCSWADDPRGRGPTGTAIRTGKPAGCADVLSDPTFHPWRERAVQFGFRSTLVVPLPQGDRTLGALSIYAPELNAFAAEEIELFEQLAADLVFVREGLHARIARAAAQAQLRASEERYRSLTIATAQIVWMTDGGGLVHEDMPSWREFTGSTREQIEGSGWLNSVHPEDRERTARLWADSVAKRTLYETEYRIRRHDGEYRDMWVRGVPVVARDGIIREWVGTCTDITERKKGQQDLERFAQELQRSNSELQEFAFVASHDLQEPLRKITAFSERLRERCAGKLDEMGLDYLGRMHNAALRMATLIDSLLAYSRLSTREVPFQEVDLASLMLGVLADLEQRRRDTGAQITIGSLPLVSGDPVQLRQLFQNLLANALKFHAPGSTPRITVRAIRSGERWEVSVTDNGIGFDPAYTEKIFRPFQRLHGRSEYEGSGMGLAICRKIAQRHGATIAVHSQPGKGTTFSVSLAASTERTHPCQETRFESSSPKTMMTTTC